VKRDVRGGSSGSVLLLSLWILALLGLVAASLSLRTRILLRLTQNRWGEIESAQLAKMAACVGRAAWRKRSAQGEGPQGTWSDDPELFKDYTVPEGSFTVTRKTVDDNGREQVYYGMEDESGKINLNSAPPEVLARLFGIHADVVPAVLNRHGAFRSVEELLLVRGVTPELFQDVNDSLTVYSAGPVNINTASGRVLQALGLPASMVRKILLLRKGTAFSNAGAVVPLLKTAASLSNAETEALSNLIRQNLLTVQPSAFRLHVLTRPENSRLSSRFSIVMSASGRGRILYWRETGP